MLKIGHKVSGKLNTDTLTRTKVKIAQLCDSTNE